MKIDLTLDKRSKIKSYRTLLKTFAEGGFSFFTHAQYFQNGPYAGKALYLRHDADRNLETALIMARIEHELGIQATYFLLPPGDYGQEENYYGKIVGNRLVPSTRLREIAQEIASLGHEIGLHNDFVQLSVKLGRDVGELIAEQIEFFKNAGIQIVGSASHGSEFVKAHGFVNYQMFSECKQAKSVARTIELPDGREFELFSVSYKELGLEYEAYSIKRDLYISDSSGTFTVHKEVFDEVDFDHLQGLTSNSNCVVALIHPDWWESPVHRFSVPEKSIKVLRRTLNSIFPAWQKNKDLCKQVALLSKKTELLTQALKASEEEIRTLREKLEQQKEKSRALYVRSKEYADRLNKKTILNEGP